MFSIQPDFSIKDIEDDFKEFEANITADLVAAMVKTLHTVVDKARANQTYRDITYNLRSSIGGIIVAESKIVEIYFPPLRKGAEGRTKGIAFAAEIANLVDAGEITLIFVAGEEYASLVEANDKDVITGSSRKIEKELLSYLK